MTFDKTLDIYTDIPILNLVPKMTALTLLLSFTLLLLTLSPTQTAHATTIRQSNPNPDPQSSCGSCPNICYRTAAANAARDCALPCTQGLSCSVQSCTRIDGTPGQFCAPDPVPDPDPTPDVTPIPIAPCPAICRSNVSDVITECITPSLIALGCRVTPCTTTSTTAPQRFACTLPANPPSPSPPPPPTSTCTFQFTTPPRTAICTCASQQSLLPIPPPVNSSLTPQSPTTPSANCYLECLDLLLRARCIPASFPDFQNAAPSVVDTCCVACVVDPIPFGAGILEGAQGCFLLP